MRRGRPELTERNEAIVRGFLDSQLRVSVLARQFSMSEPAVTRVLHRKIKPAVRGLSLTINPTLHQLQLRVAASFGSRRAKNMLAEHYLLSGQYAEAYLLQEAGVRSRLFELLAAGDGDGILGLRDKVLIAPRAARLALQRLQKHDELFSQARRLETAMAGLPERGPDLPASAPAKSTTQARRIAAPKPKTVNRAKTKSPNAGRKVGAKRRRRNSNAPSASTGWSIFGGAPNSADSKGGCLTVVAALVVAYAGLWGLYWMLSQNTTFPLLQLFAGGVFTAFVFAWAIASA